MKSKNSITFVIGILYALGALSQTSDTKQISIGQYLPNGIEVSQMSKNVPTTTQLKSLSGRKLFILDFFGTWCTPCIRALPYLDSMVDKYKGQLGIVAITTESNETTSKWFYKKGHYLPHQIKIIVKDSILKSLFPHYLIPHAVWIDENRKVVAITGDEEIIPKNIDDFFLMGRYKDFIKKDNLEFDITQPLGTGNVPIDPSKIIARSILTNQIPGVASQAQMFKNDSGKVVRFSIINLPLIHLYSFAFSKGQYGTVNFTRMILDFKDSSAYLQLYARRQNFAGWPVRVDSVEYNREWAKEHLYCYELAVPSDKSDSFYSIMLNNLNNSSSLKGEIVKRNGRCWVIKSIDKNTPPSSEKSMKWVMDADTVYSMQHVSVGELVNFINQINNIVPVIDETGWRDPVDMDIRLPIHDKTSVSLNEIRKAISPYHLKVYEEQRELPFLYLTDRK